ncbi:hypothetical protein BN439_1114 [Erwinia amylovora Ea644]|nr:hypothetical protein BN439_1114 [Erwinia amylovora Ea644]
MNETIASAKETKTRPLRGLTQRPAYARLSFAWRNSVRLSAWKRCA